MRTIYNRLTNPRCQYRVAVTLLFNESYFHSLIRDKMPILLPLATVHIVLPVDGPAFLADNAVAWAANLPSGPSVPAETCVRALYEAARGYSKDLQQVSAACLFDASNLRALISVLYAHDRCRALAFLVRAYSACVLHDFIVIRTHCFPACAESSGQRSSQSSQPLADIFLCEYVKTRGAGGRRTLIGAQKNAAGCECALIVL
jgi:hypothetical protein